MFQREAKADGATFIKYLGLCEIWELVEKKHPEIGRFLSPCPQPRVKFGPLALNPWSRWVPIWGLSTSIKVANFTIYLTSMTRWWFQIFFIFTPIWERFPIWLIFFRWVETTNQMIMAMIGCDLLFLKATDSRSLHIFLGLFSITSFFLGGICRLRLKVHWRCWRRTIIPWLLTRSCVLEFRFIQYHQIPLHTFAEWFFQLIRIYWTFLHFQRYTKC